MHEFIDDDPARSRSALEMLTVANEYCLFFEGTEKYSAQDIMTYFHRIAPLLYLKGSLLPDVEPEEGVFAGHYVTEEQWEGIFKTLRDKLGNEAKYYLHDHNFDSVEASLAENIADVYQDMKDFIMMFQNNTSQAHRQALYQVKSLYPNRWGMILANAIPAMHRKLYQDKVNPSIFEADDDWP